jgi:undecaprenyl-diphosphatase
MQKKKFIRTFVNIIPTLLFVLVVSLVIFKRDWVQSYDSTISGFVQSFRTPLLNHWISLYTQIGNTVPYIIISLIVCLILVWKNYKKEALLLVCNIILGNGINHLIKQAVQRHRPELRLIKIDGYSFPSGHSVAAMILFGSLICITFRLFKNQLSRYLLSLVYLILMLCLGLSRIYLNVHFLTDVTAGFLLGLIVIQVTSHFFYGRNSKNAR